MILPGEMEKEILGLKQDFRSLNVRFEAETECFIDDLEALKKSHENYIKLCISLQKEVGEIRKELSNKEENHGQADTQDRKGPQEGDKRHKKAS